MSVFEDILPIALHGISCICDHQIAKYYLLAFHRRGPEANLGVGKPLDDLAIFQKNCYFIAISMKLCTFVELLENCLDLEAF